MLCLWLVKVVAHLGSGSKVASCCAGAPYLRAGAS